MTPLPVPVRIVLVDDEADSREAMAMFFRMAGFVVDEFETAEEGLDSIARSAPDLVVMDLGLPGQIDGYELARRLRASPETKKVPLVALTGYAASAVRQNSAHFDAILTKPSDLADSLRVVRSLLETG
jgi:CheY-like chemotaxis protein